MSIPGLIFGLLDISAEFDDPVLAAKSRSFTLAWSRSLYFGAVLEAKTVDEILDRALERSARYCLIQAHGQLLMTPDKIDLWEVLASWLQQHEFLAAGRILQQEGAWYGLEHSPLLIDLEQYQRLGRPAFGEPLDEPRALIRPQAADQSPDPATERRCLDPSEGSESVIPALPGWHLVQASLEAGLAVRSFEPTWAQALLDLHPAGADQAAALGQYLGEGIAGFDTEATAAIWGPGERAFLATQRDLTRDLKSGVFVWNMESYADVDEPPEEREKPVSTLYCVAAGFKSNRILETHGFDENTRVVFFDYSPLGLEFRRLLLEEWDGEDYLEFLRFAFTELTSRGAFFCLWDDLGPDEIDWRDLEQRWQHELEAWGGANALRQHWVRFRKLEHTYLCANVLSQQDDLLQLIEDEPSPVIWWSNAFCSVYSNWFYTGAERQRIYEQFLAGLAARAPRLLLYGSSSENVSVNHVTAQRYYEWYRERGGDELEPAKLHRHEIRF
ncbi:MAG: hypothetical protein AAF657_32880 [Acidobacteriota bacterium]